MDTTSMLIVVVAALCAGPVLGSVTIRDVADGSTVVRTVGETAMFTCTSPDLVEWYQETVFGDLLIEGDTPPYLITAAVVSGRTTSILTIEGLTTDDSSTLRCQSAADPSDRSSLLLQVSEGLPADWVAPTIERRADTQTVVEVEQGAELRLKCEGGGQGSHLVFSLSGAVITADTDNTLLTASGKLNSNVQSLIMSREPAVGGQYTCTDATYPDTQGDSIEVVVSEYPAVRVEIITQSGAVTLGAVAGQTVDVRCQAGLGTDVAWSLDGQTLEDGVGGFVLTEAEDVSARTVTSFLTKDDVTDADAGTYTCADSAQPSDADSITLEVYQPGSEEASELGGGEDGDDGDDDGDDGDDSIFDDLFGGSPSLLPHTAAISLALVLAAAWARQ